MDYAKFISKQVKDNDFSFRKIDEGNKLFRNVEKPLSQGKEIGTVSYERSGEAYQDRGIKALNRFSMESDLKRLQAKGSISGFKGGEGRYQYGGEKDVASEKSYVVNQSDDPAKAKKFSRVLKALGKKYGQESVMRVTPDKEASYHYMDGRVEPQGKLVYNRKMKQGSGDTKLRNQSFTTQ